MGASYSFVGCLVAGGYAGANPVTENFLDGRNDKLKIIGGSAAVGLIMFLFFYQKCSWDMDLCGLVHYATALMWILGSVGGFLLGFGLLSIIKHFSGGQSFSSGPSYNTLQSMPSVSVTAPPSVAMI
mmetsp:Transcript_3191/g.4661  ORF Transcript_3191/g.4661 Transcript_3191/m.4661 type:complete len:127 (-) Transcript_3191:295-675(-)|eukprot:CAMPEP_0202456594 /NCGR_PEP_ID=MMETSP1360-20130828/13811_1 /ASSEMBLY_ACC=CAM_ASM_000848 /TAXON_ID=515479 /ORGANISM="Licmophora paradoxa, Strain CCMP2313" /LENGTH=126 /DNA_ID=CAMNT_0049076441 /DNA_START=58 /DNA_END=438 /DNA_ORIENTATION=-